MSKLLAYAIIIFIVGVNISVIGDIGATNYDDITPPVTTCTLDPAEPDGLNDWYVSDVEVILNATDAGVNKQYMIIGTGDISWLHLENESWHFGGKYRGLYRTNIIVGNGPGMLALGYCFFIKDLESGEIFSKETLPGYVYLNDFIGYLRANYYSNGRPIGFFFTIFGFADNYYKWKY